MAATAVVRAAAVAVLLVALVPTAADANRRHHKKRPKMPPTLPPTKSPLVWSPTNAPTAEPTVRPPVAPGAPRKRTQKLNRMCEMGSRARRPRRLCAQLSCAVWAASAASPADTIRARTPAARATAVRAAYGDALITATGFARARSFWTNNALRISKSLAHCAPKLTRAVPRPPPLSPDAPRLRAPPCSGRRSRRHASPSGRASPPRHRQTSPRSRL